MADPVPRPEIRSFGLSLLLVADGFFIATLLLAYLHVRRGLPAWPDVLSPVPPLLPSLALAGCLLAAAPRRNPLVPLLLLVAAAALTFPVYREAASRGGRYGVVVLLVSALLLLHQAGGAAGAALGAARGRSLQEMPFLRRYLVFLACVSLVATVAVFLL